MALFGVVVEDHFQAKQFFKETRERLGTTNLVHNPFTGGVISFISLRRVKGINRVECGYMIKMAPIYFNFAVLGALFMGIGFIIFPRLWIGIVVGIFLLCSLFWWSKFYYFILKLGLKKKGYRGSIRYLNPKQILEEVYFNGNK